MPERSALAGVLAVCLFAAPARAEEPAVDCTKASTTPEIALCAAQDYTAADVELNAAYKTMLAEIDAATAGRDEQSRAQRRAWREALTEAQRKWIAFRDADCAAVGAAWMGGTGMGTAISTCLTEATRARTAALTRRAKE